MMVYYVADHPEVKLDADLIHPAIAPERLKWEAAVYALRWRYTRTKQDDPAQIALLNEGKERVAELAKMTMQEAEQNKQRVRVEYRIPQRKMARLSQW